MQDPPFHTRGTAEIDIEISSAFGGRFVQPSSVLMIHREVAELNDVALTNKTKDKSEQGDVF